MSREIKFRAWHKAEKRMFQVSAIQFHWFVCEEGSIKTWTFDDIELREYIGLKDKQGKEIYEGDIVQAGKSVTAPVVFEKGCFDLEGVSYYSIREEHLEIIGNIYENPELLEKQP